MRNKENEMDVKVARETKGVSREVLRRVDKRQRG